MIQTPPRINDMSRSDGFFTESLAASMSQTTDGAKEGLRAFLEKRPPKFNYPCSISAPQPVRKLNRVIYGTADLKTLNCITGKG
ncbi:hypothetical protein AB833_23290 [Chromatiales bacterium (ex Bugula neritina AB1)]|nr:hypothetical protein AB833_23290 [Chromatiales bacterium (ex Bugula neritina AB1)]